MTVLALLKMGFETYPLLESSDLLVGQSIGLGNDGDEVDLGVKTFHHLDVQRLQRMARWLNEKDAGMDPVVNNVHTIDLVLGVEVGIKALLDVVNNRPPRLVVVHEVAKAGRVDNGQAQTNTSLLNVSADGLDGDSLGNDVEARALALLGRVKRGVEQSVDQSRLSEARFTCVLSASAFERKRFDLRTYQRP